MKNALIVFNYELRSHLMKKSVRVFTVLMALIVFGATFIPRITTLFGGQKNAASQKAAFENAGFLFDENDELKGYPEKIGVPESNLYTDASALKDDVKSGRLSVGYIVHSPTGFETVWKDKALEDEDDKKMEAALRAVYIADELSRRNLTVEEVNAIQNVSIRSDNTVLGKNSANNLLLAFALLFVVYIFVLVYGSVTSTMIAREKDSKAMELLITSTSPSSLIFGKVAAAAVSAVLQVSLTALAALIGFAVNKSVMPPALMMMLSGTLTRSYLLSYLYYTLVGYVMYLFLYAALGSTVSKVEDVNNTTGFVQLLFIAGYVVSSFAIRQPSAPYVVAASIFPFTSLLVMPMRCALSTVPFWQHLLSGGILMASSWLLALLSVKIYRWGTLNYGNKTSFFKIVKAVLKKQ